MNAIVLVRDTLARTAAASEALLAGDVTEASAILADLGFDLKSALATIGDDVVRVSLADFNDIPA